MDFIVRSNRQLLAIKFSTKLLVAVAMVVASLAVFSSSPADGYVSGDCKFSGSNPSVKFKFNSVDSHYQTITYYASTRWNNTSAPGSFSATTSTTRNIDVYDAYYSWTHRAITEGGCSLSGGPNTWSNNRVKVKYNTRYMDGTQSTYLRNQHTAIHEFGHAYGLSHDTSVNCSSTGKAVMYTNSYWVYDNCSSSPIGPYWDDVAGVTNQY